jgi:hypothetical protein
MSREPSLLATTIKAAEQPAAAPAARRNLHSAVAGKTAKTHHLPPAYWETLEEVSFRTPEDKGKRIPQERLVAEALNLLFAKYNFPVVREGGE